MEMTMPKFEETIDSAVIIKWHKGIGETIAKGESLLEVETEKFTHSIEAPIDARVLELKAAEGEEVDAGEPIAILEPIGSSSS